MHKLNFRIPHFRSLLLLLLVCLFLPFNAEAQILGAPAEKEDKEEKIPEDPLGRRSPRGTVTGFIDAMAGQNYSRAARYLELSSISNQEKREEIVQVLLRLLDQGGDILPYSLISKNPEGRTDDNLDQDTDRIGSISADGEVIDILLVQTRDENANPVWLFSEESLSQIASLTLDRRALVNRIMPEFLQNRIWGGVPAGQWIIAVLLIFLSYALAWSLISFITFLLPRLLKAAKEDPVSGIIGALKLPLMLYAAVWIFVIFSRNLGLSIIIRQKFSVLIIIIGIAALLILLWRLSDFLGKYSQQKMILRGNPSGVSIVLFLQRAVKIAIVIFGVIAILGILGINVTAGLAALGIGGIALALGAQKTIENFVGSVTLIADRPIRVGDFCRVGEILGTVEKIGVRSTRIRTLDRTLVTIPNGAFSSDTIENYAHRDKFRFHSIINFRYETSPDQLRFLLAELRKVLYAHPKVFEDPARIRFIGFGSSSLDIEIFAYLNALDYNEFLEIKEDLMLLMMDVVERSGTDFAFPSQTLYFAKDEGLSKEKGEIAENQVKKWREKGEMPIPKYSEEQIESLRSSLDYPPKGSVARKESPEN
ncbi:MAG: mechanosensitive ion channel [Salegentibacter sp.]|uniref:MscS family membrane protein n=1 Tax=Salegentibacter flavus TaxID=287099 RepID=A0A1I4ZE40_9FLAO|nr:MULTISPECIES: mechanosensitive ion channel family protein [Salegentibacter]MDR9456805.1 mechanosensitive ion channel [Salegentibacter sp.]SFN48467.1 MscS family membrane protein [Salegentibacter flavus]